ncbi:hypothetical protein FQN60_018665 [Etheostoma spectabile]|uniref:Uncharacterized protein n=1 Tax=Etheostoma spectabile TaxID=54343 RepID=A0A5J5CBB1_9PERO|nr:hypothetical protein FQN60_018665 [Etheostoma spectabile]
MFIERFIQQFTWPSCGGYELHLTTPSFTAALNDRFGLVLNKAFRFRPSPRGLMKGLGLTTVTFRPNVFSGPAG